MTETVSHNQVACRGEVSSSARRAGPKSLFTVSAAVLLLFAMVGLMDSADGIDHLADGNPGFSSGRLVQAAFIVTLTGMWLLISVYRYICSAPVRYATTSSRTHGSL